jgi:zinc ribbon protein
MGEGHRFCGRCGHELRSAARYCGNCGHTIPESASQAAAGDSAQNPGAGRQQGSDLPAYARTATAVPPPAPPVAVGELPGGTAGFRPGRPPPTQAPPPGAGTPWRGTPPRTSRRPDSRWPLMAALAVLVAGGGIAVGLLLTRHSAAQAPGQASIAEAPPSTSSAPTQAQPTPTPTPTQVSLHGVTVGISAVNNDPDATNIAYTLATYFGGIDAKNYRQAWHTYTAALQAAVPYQHFAEELKTSQDSQVVEHGIQHDANGNIEAAVSFQSHQAGQYGPNRGETCTNWSLDYHMVPTANATSGPLSLSYLIDKVTIIGAGHTSC